MIFSGAGSLRQARQGSPAKNPGLGSPQKWLQIPECRSRNHWLQCWLMGLSFKGGYPVPKGGMSSLLNLSLPLSLSPFPLSLPSLPPSSLPFSLPFPHPYLLSVYAYSVLLLRKYPVHAHGCTYLWKPNVNLGCDIPQVPSILVCFVCLTFRLIYFGVYACIHETWLGRFGLPGTAVMV